MSVVFTTKVRIFMDKYLTVLKTVSLFRDIESEDIKSLLKCLSAKTENYKAKEAIFLAGNKSEYVGIVLSGQAQVVKEDFYGNKNIVASVEKGQLFGEAFACADIKIIPVSVFAVEDCEIMLIDYRRIITVCPHNCTFHGKLIYNMLRIVANKNIMLSQKIEFISKRTTKEKLLAYLLSEAKKAGSNSFSIPFNRQELADYLSVDRSAMSAELCKLRDRGIIEFNKNKFVLKD